MMTRLQDARRRLRPALMYAAARGAKVALWLGLLFSAVAALVSRNPAFQPWPALVCWILGLGLFVAGVAGNDFGAEGRPVEQATGATIAHWELIILLLLSMAALTLRGYGLESIPHNIHGDEGEMGMIAREVLSGTMRDPFSTSWGLHPSLWFFLQALGLLLFGNNIGGLRMVSAVIGATTVPVLFFFARPLFGRRVALISALLLTVYHFHIQFSRLGISNIADPALLLLTLHPLFHGIRSGSRGGFALAGVMAGVAQYFYFGTRLIPVLVLLLLGYLLIWQRNRLRSLGPRIGMMFVGFIAAIAPLVVYYASQPETFVAKYSSRFLLQDGGVSQLAAPGQTLLAALVEHAYRSLFYYFAVKEQGQFYGAGIPMLDHGMEVLFLGGILIALWRWKRLGDATLLIWVAGVAFFGGFLLWQSQESQRYLMAAPALCIAMAVGLEEFGMLLIRGGGFNPAFSRAATSTLLLALVTWNLQFYFGVYTPRNDYANAQAVTELADTLAAHSDSWYVYFFTAPQLYLNHGTIRFVANDPAGIDVTQPLASIADLPPARAGLEPVFVFTPDRIAELDLVKQQYPTGKLIELHRNPGSEQVLLYMYEPSP